MANSSPKKANISEFQRDVHPEQVSNIIEEITRLWSQASTFEQLLEVLEGTALEQAKKLEETLDELKRTQSQLIQSEKMSSLGQLVAGIAHEINNPVGFISSNVEHAKTHISDLLYLLRLYQQNYPEPTEEIQEAIEQVDLQFIEEDLPNILSSMQGGSQRIAQIVLSLRNFSRLDESELKAVNIHEGLESVLCMVRYYLDQNKIDLVTAYNDLPLVECFPSYLNQVFMCMITNAIEAIAITKQHLLANLNPSLSKEQPDVLTISIRTERSDADRVAIFIADNGCGMTEDVQKKMFDPFFTTKPVGKGTGMGLALAYKTIVEQHGGDLRCKSSPKGTEFCITIPIHQNQSSKIR